MASPADTEGAKLKGTAVLLEEAHTGTSVRPSAAAWQNPDMQLLSVIQESQNLFLQGFDSTEVKLKCSETLIQILFTTIEVKLGVEQNYLQCFRETFSLLFKEFSIVLLSPYSFSPFWV